MRGEDPQGRFTWGWGRHVRLSQPRLAHRSR
jgi:hypothetical protein